MAAWSDLLHPRGPGGKFAPKLGVGKVARARHAFAVSKADMRASEAFAHENAARAALEHARRFGVRVGEHEQRHRQAQALSRGAVAGLHIVSAREMFRRR